LFLLGLAPPTFTIMPLVNFNVKKNKTAEDEKKDDSENVRSVGKVEVYVHIYICFERIFIYFF
jgi:hypothetical protein